MIKRWWNNLPVGTKSVLVGAHAFWLHPFLVWAGWVRLYGWTWSLPVITSFFVHDLGYWGCTNMDGDEGKFHPHKGAFILSGLFDGKQSREWLHFSLYHSRKLAKVDNKVPSRLCWADKMAFVLDPSWFYLWRCRLTGELDEYVKDCCGAEYATAEEWLKDSKEMNKQQCFWQTQGEFPSWL